MMVVLVYDVSTSDAEGRRRLRKVAKACTRYGQRVQDSVFECLVEPAEYQELIGAVKQIIDLTCDSVTVYNLGANWKRRVERFGFDDTYDPQGTLII